MGPTQSVGSVAKQSENYETHDMGQKVLGRIRNVVSSFHCILGTISNMKKYNISAATHLVHIKNYRTFNFAYCYKHVMLARALSQGSSAMKTLTSTSTV